MLKKFMQCTQIAMNVTDNIGWGEFLHESCLRIVTCFQMCGQRRREFWTHVSCVHGFRNYSFLCIIRYCTVERKAHLCNSLYSSLLMRAPKNQIGRASCRERV